MNGKNIIIINDKPNKLQKFSDGTYYRPFNKDTDWRYYSCVSSIADDPLFIKEETIDNVRENPQDYKSHDVIYIINKLKKLRRFVISQGALKDTYGVDVTLCQYFDWALESLNSYPRKIEVKGGKIKIIKKLSDIDEIIMQIKAQYILEYDFYDNDGDKAHTTVCIVDKAYEFRPMIAFESKGKNMKWRSNMVLDTTQARYSIWIDRDNINKIETRLRRNNE